MQSRFRGWDLLVVVACAMILAGMFLPWWSLDPGGILAELGLGDGDLYGELPGLLGISNGFSGWESDLSGVGTAAVVLSFLALSFALLKLSFPRGAPLPLWYREGWVVATAGVLCLVFGAVVCLKPPAGGFGLWQWQPWSLLMPGGGLVLLVAGVFMTKDQTGGYQRPGRLLAFVSVPASASQQPASDASKCGSCGAALPEGAAFCPACGSRV